MSTRAGDCIVPASSSHSSEATDTYLRIHNMLSLVNGYTGYRRKCFPSIYGSFFFTGCIDLSTGSVYNPIFFLTPASPLCIILSDLVEFLAIDNRLGWISENVALVLKRQKKAGCSRHENHILLALDP